MKTLVPPPAVVHVCRPNGGNLCEEENGTATLFMFQVNCQSCLVHLDLVLEEAYAEVEVAGSVLSPHPWVKWRSDLFAPKELPRLTEEQWQRFVESRRRRY